MKDALSDIDERSRSAWNDSYDLKEAAVLWSAGGVPFAARAAAFASAAGARIGLDVPCGDGRNLRPLAQAIPVMIGADSSRRALDIAAATCREQGVRNCVLLTADVFDTAFADEQFDFVFCWDVLGHLKNAHDAVRELVRITRRGGHIIGSVFAPGDSTRGKDMAHVQGEEYIYRDRFYYRFYTREEAEALFHDLPVDIVSVELEVWAEPPHENFREYEHEHQSWAVTVRRR
ncbi:MAG TPA: class I SAM-dependent methyltransferase [Thermoanaerobaculia bacterium]|nr:class I SAM-dependent methyltransferase [Thermoanaerobaculia bacterium]